MQRVLGPQGTFQKISQNIASRLGRSVVNQFFEAITEVTHV